MTKNASKGTQNIVVIRMKIPHKWHNKSTSRSINGIFGKKRRKKAMALKNKYIYIK
jgi:hypothetical protein